MENLHQGPPIAFGDTFAPMCSNSAEPSVFQNHPFRVVNMNQAVFNITFGDLLTIPTGFFQHGCAKQSAQSCQ